MQSLALVTVLAALTATSDVRAVAAEGDVLWLGTTGGLVRLEGDSARTLTPREGLPDGTIRALHRVGGSLWVGTDRGAARIELRTGRVVQSVRAPAVHSIETWGDQLWLGTWDGLYRLDADAGTTASVGGPNRITAIRGVGSLLYVTTAGERIHVFDGRAFRQLRGDRLSWDIAARGNEAWVATSRGVRVYVDGRPRPRPAVRLSRDLPVADVRALCFVGDRLVAGTHGGGLVSWTGSAWQPVAEGPSWLARVTTVAATPSGEMMVGTPDGLALRGDSGWSERWTGSGLPGNDLSCLARTDEGLWVGTFRAGLALLRTDGSVEVWTEDHGLVDDRINRLAVDSDGDLWIATERGVMERTDGRFHMRGLLGRHVYVVGVVGDEVFASAGPDLLRWNGTSFEVVEEHPGRRLQDLAEGPDAAIVAGTAEGLALGSSTGWSLIGSGPDALPDDWATAVVRWGDALVVGTYNAGLALVDGDEAEPLRPGLWVNAGAMAVAGGTLAVGTLDQGLWLYDGEGWRTLTTAQGLPDDDVTDVLPDGAGGLWIATRGGLARAR